MYSHLTLGTANVPRAARFYDQALKPLGLVRKRTVKIAASYAPEDFDGANEPFWLVRPYDKGEASPGNGVTVAFNAESRAEVDAFHAAALAAGGMMSVRPDCARIIIRIITAPMCATLTATRSAPFAMIRPIQAEPALDCQRVQTMATTLQVPSRQLPPSASDIVR